MAAELDRRRHTGQVAGDQGDVAGSDRYIGAGTHGDAHIGLGQGRRVVDAIAHHRHRPLPLGLEQPNHGGLIGGTHFSDHPLNPRLRCHQLGGTAGVATEHHQLQSLAPQGRHGSR